MDKKIPETKQWATVKIWLVGNRTELVSSLQSCNSGEVWVFRCGSLPFQVNHFVMGNLDSSLSESLTKRNQIWLTWWHIVHTCSTLSQSVWLIWFVFTFQPTSHWTLYVLLIGHYSLPPPLSVSLIITLIKALTPDPIRNKKGRVYAECCYWKNSDQWVMKSRNRSWPMKQLQFQILDTFEVKASCEMNTHV